MTKKYAVAVLGATGLVGEAMMWVLERRNFPIGRFVPLASARSAGRTVTFRGEQYPIEVLEDFDFSGIDIGLFSAGASVSALAAPRA